MTNKELVLAAMRSLGKSDAEDLQSRIPNMTDTEIINEEEKIPAWDGNKDYTTYPTGFAVSFPIDGELNIFGLLQPHNAAHYPNDNPDNNRALWSLKHTKNPLKARGYVRPNGTSGLYMKEECYRSGEVVYISKIDNNADTFEEYPQGWGVWDKGETVR